ncbi:non-canonical purine NTP pyrophosphatase, partial [Vibrio natriegens]
MSKLVLATGNQGKVREMASLLADFGFDVVAQSDYN